MAAYMEQHESQENKMAGCEIFLSNNFRIRVSSYGQVWHQELIGAVGKRNITKNSLLEKKQPS